MLVVGEVNPLSTDPEYALYPMPVGCAGWRYATRVAGVPQDYHLATWRTNLCTGKWSMKEARHRAQRLLDPFETPWDVVIMLGRKVAEAFQYRGEPFTHAARQTLCDVMGDDPRAVQLVYIPHPSGLNREWQKPGAYERARAVLSEAAPSWYGAAATHGGS